ncbi:MAG: hypothetical protein ACI89W_000938 [Gammaproteobacteria bacterium]|jgi:hypothetical protein
MSLLDDKSAGIQSLKGIISPKFVVRRVIDGMQGVVDKPSATNILYPSLLEEMKKRPNSD